MQADENRIYLEDIGEIVMSRSGKDIWLVKGITQHEDFKDRYQGTPLCWVGDIGDSIYKPEDHLMETFSDMLAVGMDFDREDFSLWSPIMRSEHFLTRFETEHPEVFKELKQYLRPI